MFKSILATVGIGAAKVDTVLTCEHLQPGQLFSAEILIFGGDVEQEISGLELYLMTKVKVESEQGDYFTNHIIDSWKIVDKCTVAPSEQKRIPFEARLHPETPITEIYANQNQSHVWLTTELNIDLALDAKDKDPIFVHPNEAVKTFIQAMEKIGFALVKSDVEKGYLNAANFRSESGCYQELEFKPKQGSMFGIREVELSFIPEAHRTHVLIELDRAFRGDGYIDLTVEHDEVNLAQLCDRLDHLLN